MSDVTLIELHVEDGTFSANLPFSGLTSTGTDESEIEDEASEDDEESSGRSKGLALLGVLIFFIIATAAVKYLSGGDEADVKVDTAE